MAIPIPSTSPKKISAPLKFSILADRWGKTGEDIVVLTIKYNITTIFWYTGMILAVDMNGAPVNAKDYDDWVIIEPGQIVSLQAKPNVTLYYFFATDTFKQKLLPTTENAKPNPEGYTITLDDLRIPISEIKRLEQSYPELTTGKAEHTNRVQARTGTSDSSIEKPLKTRGEIAKYMGISITTLRKFRRKNRLPCKMEGGIVIAYPSKIAKWRRRNPKKK